MVCRRCSYSARSVTRPLCATTGVIVQTVQFLDKVVAVPVVFTTGAHGSRRAENVWRCSRCSSALLGDVPVTMQRFCGVYGDRAVQGFAVFLRLFSASSSELRPCQFMTVVMWTYTHS